VKTMRNAMSTPRRKRRTLVLVTIFALHTPLMAQNDGERIAGGIVRTLHSRVLDEDRVLLVGLPDEYDSTTAAYPVLYKLDGDERAFKTALSELNALRNARQIPPMILVGIPNTDRDRDMLPVAVPGRRGSGGAGDFLRFVRDEMIPFVEEHYRASDFSIVMGTSNSALFAVYTFVSEPSTFDAYLASSPMIGHSPELVRSATEKLLSRASRIDRALYIIYGDRDSPGVTEAVPPFLRQLRADMPEGLRLEHVVLPGEGHVPASSLTRGLTWIYAGVDGRARDPVGLTVVVPASSAGSR